MKGKSPLRTTQMSPDSCVMEIFFVRVPFDDTATNVDLWQDVDEQHFSPQLRKQLLQNGFRVGMIGGQMPVTLSKLLEISEKPGPTGESPATEAVDMEEEPRVVRRQLQSRAGRRSEIMSSDVYERLPVLMAEEGHVSGQTYEQAQAIWALKTTPQPDGCVNVELTPEVHHDKMRQRWVGRQGMLRLEAGRPRRTFDNLAVTAKLCPGSFLVMTSLPNRSGSLGHHFFTEEKDQLEQKLLVIRLAQTQHDEMFSPPEVLDLADAEDE